MNSKPLLAILISLVLKSNYLMAQTSDSLKIINLKSVDVELFQRKSDKGLVQDVMGTTIFSGKKADVLLLSNMDADLSTNNSRQLFAKVPGINIWENDGSGIQTSISSRGLSPNRSWEFNMRQNGYDISADPFGYPESYYTPPSEAIEKIEVIRGAASLQFGPQFGGVVNYKMKQGAVDKPIEIEMRNTVGSYGLFDTYNSVGGTLNKFNYYGFVHYRSADGWRKNSQYSTLTGHASLHYYATTKLKFGFEFTRMVNESQQAGGLTDSMFAIDARQSVRARNWFSTPWNLIALTMNYEVTKSLKCSTILFGTLAERNSIGFTKSITTPDTINTTTLSYAPRQADKDQYINYGIESRLVYNYHLGKNENVLAAGIRYSEGKTTRNQQGVGSTASDFDMTVLSNQFAKSFDYTTKNIAMFAEHIFVFGQRFKLIPGIRYELLNNTSEGQINSEKLKSQSRDRAVLLTGVGAEFMLKPAMKFYANFSQAYRPITFSELTPSATSDSIDANLKDATGYNLDLGFKGDYKKIVFFDFGIFYLNYANRIGTMVKDGINFKTNLGASESKGIESFVEVDVLKLLNQDSKNWGITLFSSNALTDARYTSWENPVIANDPSKSIKDKKVENVPAYIHRMGINYHYQLLTITIQMNKVGSVFTDATNAIKPNATATIGQLSGYTVADFSFTVKVKKRYRINGGINNLLNEVYATRRSTGYPGPGILPGNARTFYVGFGGVF